MSAVVLLGAPGLASAGSPAATQYPNPAALIGTARGSSSEPPGSIGRPAAAGPTGTGTTGTGTTGTPTTGTGTPAGPPSLVGIASGPAHRLGSADTVGGTLPATALWAIAFAALCALVAAWLVRLR